jgi:copper transport protein
MPAERRWLLLAGSVWVALWGLALTAWAHAYIIKSNPAPGQVLARAPTQVQIWFDEPIASPLDQIQVTGSNGQRVDAGDGHVDAKDPRLIECSLRPGLPDGLYSVQWRVISADGHPVSGVIPFRVGRETNGVGIVHANPTLLASMPGPAAVLDRAAFYVGLLCLIGAIVYTRWVVPPTLRPRAPWGRGAVLWPLWTLLLLAVLANLPVEVRTQLSVPWSAVFYPAQIRALLDTRFGILWLVQLAAVVLVGNFIWWRTAFNETVYAVAALVLLAVAVAAKSLTSHAAGADVPALAVTLDAVHMLAAGAWIGGLLGLLTWLPRLRNADAKERSVYWAALRRFTPLGMGCVAVLGVTGMYGALAQIPSWYALESTVYGRTFLIKLGLFALMLGFALYHALRGQMEAGPAAAGESESRGVGRTLALEWLVGLAVLIVTAVLTNLPPALAASGPVSSTHVLGNAVATLQITPNVAGPNVFTVDLTDRDGKPITDAQQVVLTMKSLDMSMGTVSVRLVPAGAGVYRASGLYLTMGGRWDVQLQVLTADFQQWTTDYQIRVGVPGVQ